MIPYSPSRVQGRTHRAGHAQPLRTRPPDQAIQSTKQVVSASSSAWAPARAAARLIAMRPRPSVRRRPPSMIWRSLPWVYAAYCDMVGLICGSSLISEYRDLDAAEVEKFMRALEKWNVGLLNGLSHLWRIVSLCLKHFSG